MDDFDFIDGIKVRALRAAWKPDYDAMLRQVFRWYSEKYHTPLHLIDDLPLEDVLQTWFEVQYHDMPAEERHNLAIYLLEDEGERRQRDAMDRKADDDFFMLTKAKASAQKQKKDLREKISEMKSKIDELRKTKAAQFKPVTDKPMKDLDLYQPPKSAPVTPKEAEEVVLVHTDEDFEDDDFIAPKKKS